MNKQKLLKEIETQPARSAWGKGVRLYAYELLEDIPIDAFFCTKKEKLETLLLNGASNWHEYSWGGSAFCYNEDIAERLCNQSELKRCKGGINRPNRHEDWLDVQARALYQAYILIKRLYNMEDILHDN